MAQGRTAAQKIVFWILSFVATALILTLVIRGLYPLYDHDFNRQPKTLWLAGYAASVLVLSVLVVLSAAFWGKRLGNRPALASLFSAITTFAVLLLYYIIDSLMGPSGVGWGVIDEMNAKFMAEWKFLNFVGILAPTCSLLSALLTRLSLRHGSRP